MVRSGCATNGRRQVKRPSHSLRAQDKVNPEGTTVATNAGAESAYAWLRLGICAALSTIGGISLWSVVVVLPQDAG